MIEPIAKLGAKILGRGPALTADQLRSSRPARNPIVEAECCDDGSIVLSAPLASVSSGWTKALARRAPKESSKKFELEPIGAQVWELCDGIRTFEGIASELRKRFKMNRLEAETALAAFLQMLGRRNLITLEIPNPKERKKG